MSVLTKEQRELLIFRLDFCSDYVLLAVEFQIKIHIASSSSQEVLLKKSPSFLPLRGSSFYTYWSLLNKQLFNQTC